MFNISQRYIRCSSILISFLTFAWLESCVPWVKGIHPTSFWAPNTNQRPFTEAFQIQNLQASVHSERVQGAPANRSRCIANQLSYWLLGLWLYQWQVQLLYRLYIHICIIYIYIYIYYIESIEYCYGAYLLEGNAVHVAVDLRFIMW